jgi:hypothetical protein
VSLALLSLGEHCAKTHGVIPPALGERLQELAEGVYIRGHDDVRIMILTLARVGWQEKRSASSERGAIRP